MGKIIMEGMKLLFQTETGETELLLDTLDLYRSCGTTRMHEEVPDGTGKHVAYPLANQMSILWRAAENTEFAEARRVIAIRMADCLQEKYRPWQVLLQGWEQDGWTAALTESVQACHEAARVWSKDSELCLLPRKRLDMIVLNTSKGEAALSTEEMEALLLSVKPGGRIWLSGTETPMLWQQWQIPCKEYRISREQLVCELRMSKQLWEQIDQESMQYAERFIRQDIENELQELEKAAGKVPPEACDQLIQQSRQLEKYIQILYPCLESLTIRQKMNRLTEALICFRLKQIKREEILATWQQVWQEWMLQ